MAKNNQKMTIRKIETRFNIIENEVSQLVQDKYYFEKYKEYIAKSKNIDKNQDFLFFIAKNYQVLGVINVCKQVDEDSRSESMVNLLKDIKNNKNLFTLKWYKRQWKPVPISNSNRKISRSREAENCFQQFSIKDNSIISCQKIDRDIQEIKKAINGLKYGKKKQSISIASLRKYRNKRGAHFEKGKPKIDVPAEYLNKAIDLLEKMISKYNLLFAIEGMNSLLPVNIDTFLELGKIFKK